jgi:hypothetical protein
MGLQDLRATAHHAMVKLKLTKTQNTTASPCLAASAAKQPVACLVPVNLAALPIRAISHVR